jgi:ABC-2 type transport system ATP-binding protein
LIETRAMGRRFGPTVAVEDLSLKVKDGEVFGLLGPNGAGKTTTVRMLCGLISLSSGEAYIDGLDIRDPHQRLDVRGMIGLLPESPGLYESLSAYGNLEFYAKLYGCDAACRERRIKELLKALDLWDRRDQPVASFSKGMKQKIAIARALVHEPKFLFLDEPTSGLDPSASVTVRNYLLDLKKEGRTIFLNTHNLDEAERLCGRIAILNTRLLAIGRPEELAQDYFGRHLMVQVKEPGALDISRFADIQGVLKVAVQGDGICFTVDDPVARAPEVVRRIVNAGAEVVQVYDSRRSLEDVYLRIVGGDGNALR